MLTSQGVVVATAMAVSGTFILLALRLQKNLPVTQFTNHNTIITINPLPRSCISSDGKRRNKKKKKVHFAEDVVDPIGNSEDFRKQHKINYVNALNIASNSSNKNNQSDKSNMPKNRAVLYKGMLQNRVVHQRFAYSY